jgi:hypothetical protein
MTSCGNGLCRRPACRCLGRPECAAARERVAAAPSLEVTATQNGRDFLLRWIMIHMIEEYARHDGHAALLRQWIDGVVGV